MANQRKKKDTSREEKGFKSAFTAPFTPVKQYEDGKTRPYHPQNPRKQA